MHSERKMEVNILAKYISLFQDGGILVDAVKECKIITLKYSGKTSRLMYLLYSSAPEDIILLAIRPGSTKFEGQNVYKLIRSKG